MGKNDFASGLYIIAATACYLLVAINIHLLLERGEPLIWMNFAMAVVLGVAGIVLSCLAARSSQTEVVHLEADEADSGEVQDWGIDNEASRYEFQEYIENNTEELCKAAGIPYRKL